MNKNSPNNSKMAKCYLIFALLFDMGSINLGSIHQIYDSTLLGLRTRPCAIRLVDESQDPDLPKFDFHFKALLRVLGNTPIHPPNTNPFLE